MALDLSGLKIDLTKLDDTDRSAILRDFVDAAKRLAKCTDTPYDDLLIKLIETGIGPHVMGSEFDKTKAAILAAAGLSPEMLMLIVQIASQILSLFTKK